ncbi:MAG TPA: M28 family peptidase [Gemmatimonadaceae bacterium]|nr:M28 family peptidase [Gemmatimonadaceae bacterium]
MPPFRRGWVLIVAACLAAGVSCVTVQPLPTPATPVEARMEEDLVYLASPELAGRLTGTPGNDSAAAFIERRYSQLGLKAGFSGASCGTNSCGAGFVQVFRIGAFQREDVDVPISDRTQNVAAIVTGTDTALNHEYIVVGAHYDHIGRSNALARGFSNPGVIHPGADDNASGTTAILELARRFADRPARRSVLIVSFSAEELGLIGSEMFLRNIPVPLDSIVTMVNLDMVGRLRDNRMILFAAKDHTRFGFVADSVNRLSPALELRFSWRSGTEELSDHATFARAHVPVLGLFTDYHPDYHASGDVASRINYHGLERVVDFTERFVRAIADSNDSLIRRDQH